jgi:hypothetical protein
MTHTPGPWVAKFYGAGDSYRITYNEKGNWLADVWIDGDKAKAVADAVLIAAAPDLLGALDWLAESDEVESPEALAVIRDAIAKAKGKV